MQTPSDPVKPSANPADGDGSRNGSQIAIVTESSLDSMIGHLGVGTESSWIETGDVCHSMGADDRALICYAKALQINPHNERALSQMAAIHHARSEHQEALSFNQRLLNLNNENGNAWHALAQSYAGKGNTQHAYAAFQQALITSKNQANPLLWYDIGVMYERCKDFDNAEAAYMNALSVSEDFTKKVEVCYRIARIMRIRGRIDESLVLLKKMIDSPPAPLSNADIFYQCALCYEEKREFKTAREMYHKVFEEPKISSIVFHDFARMALSSDLNGGVDEAISLLQRLLRTKREDQMTHYLLARCFMAQSRYKDAHEHFKKAVIKEPSNPFFWCSCGVLFIHLGQYGDALDSFARVLRTTSIRAGAGDKNELRFVESIAWYNIGSLYYWCNQMDDCLKAYENSCRADPSNILAKKRLEMIQSLPSDRSPQQAVEGVQPTLMENGVSLVVDSDLSIKSPFATCYKRQKEQEELEIEEADIPRPRPAKRKNRGARSEEQVTGDRSTFSSSVRSHQFQIFDQQFLQSCPSSLLRMNQIPASQQPWFAQQALSYPFVVQHNNLVNPDSELMNQCYRQQQQLQEFQQMLSQPQQQQRSDNEAKQTRTRSLDQLQPSFDNKQQSSEQTTGT